MLQRGIQTKHKILHAAKELFMRKGYSAVTMSDLCEAVGLSRGGLYRHFKSTREVFTALLTDDKITWEKETNGAIAAGYPASKMLTYFFEQVAKGISEGEGRLSLAIYEYERTGQDIDFFLVTRYNNAIDMMKKVLKYGQSRGEFGEFDPKVRAEQIVIFVDGLKMAAAGIPLPEITVKQQLDYLVNEITGGQTI